MPVDPRIRPVTVGVTPTSLTPRAASTAVPIPAKPPTGYPGRDIGVPAFDLASLRRDAAARADLAVKTDLVAIDRALQVMPPCYTFAQLCELLTALDEVTERIRADGKITFGKVAFAVLTLGVGAVMGAVAAIRRSELIKVIKHVRAHVAALHGQQFDGSVTAPGSVPPRPGFDFATNSRITDDNDVALLIGHESFKRRYELIASAKHSIHLQTLFFADDETGLFTERMLAAKAQGRAFREKNPFGPPEYVEFPAGPRVEVRVIVDLKAQVGNDFTYTPIWARLKTMLRRDDIITRLRREGVDAVQYLPPASDIAKTWHQKLFVVDGRTAVTGGMNVASEYAYGGTDRVDASLDPKRPKIGWRDTDVELRGSIVHDMQATFLENWRVCKGQDLTDRAEYFPAPLGGGRTRARFVSQRPVQDGEATIERLYIQSIDNATTSIHLTNAYVVPSRALIDALTRAARRGVDVQIVTNSDDSNDYELMSDAAQRSYPELLAAGVRIFERRGKGRTTHAKTAVFDGKQSIVGSANLDTRSGRLDSEDIIEVPSDRDFATRMERQFVSDKLQTDEITLATLERWGAWEKVKSWFWGSPVVRSVV